MTEEEEGRRRGIEGIHSSIVSCRRDTISIHPFEWGRKKGSLIDKDNVFGTRRASKRKHARGASERAMNYIWDPDPGVE